MKLYELQPAEGSVKDVKRIGRGHGSGNDHDIALSGRGTKDLRTKAGHVKPGTTGRHHFDGTAGDTEG